MAGYDPKAKRAHSAAAPDGPAPVDDLLGAPKAPPPTPSAPAEASPAPTPTPTPPPAARPAAASTPPWPEARPLAPTPAAANGPDPKVLAAVVATVLALLFFWRHRRRGSA